jgi:hypothetical protein
VLCCFRAHCPGCFVLSCWFAGCDRQNLFFSPNLISSPPSGKTCLPHSIIVLFLPRLQAFEGLPSTTTRLTRVIRYSLRQLSDVTVLLLKPAIDRAIQHQIVSLMLLGPEIFINRALPNFLYLLNRCQAHRSLRASFLCKSRTLAPIKISAYPPKQLYVW